MQPRAASRRAYDRALRRSSDVRRLPAPGPRGRRIPRGSNRAVAGPARRDVARQTAPGHDATALRKGDEMTTIRTILIVTAIAMASCTGPTRGGVRPYPPGPRDIVHGVLF